VRLVSLAFAFVVGCGSNEQPNDSGPVDTGVPDTYEDTTPDDTGVEDTGWDAGPPPVIYAHTESSLYRFDVPTLALTYVADFSCAAEQMQDIAVDGTGAMVGVTLSSLVAIDPKTAACKRIAAGQYPTSLSFAPAGLLDAGEELLGFNYLQYLRIDRATGAVTFAGSLAPGALKFPVTASGDLVVASNKHGYVSCNGPSPPNQDDLIVEFDPLTGKSIRLVKATSVPSLLGLAAWQGSIYAFSAGGRVMKITPGGAMTEVWPGDSGAEGGIPFSGAAVSTTAP
jgi:hypothetical protein